MQIYFKDFSLFVPYTRERVKILDLSFSAIFSIANVQGRNTDVYQHSTFQIFTLYFTNFDLS